jgi:hypothetical protein
MFIYFLKGQLPWQGFKIDMKEEKFEKVLEKKKNTSDTVRHVLNPPTTSTM